MLICLQHRRKWKSGGGGRGGRQNNKQYLSIPVSEYSRVQVILAFVKWQAQAPDENAGKNTLPWTVRENPPSLKLRTKKKTVVSCDESPSERTSVTSPQTPFSETSRPNKRRGDLFTPSDPDTVAYGFSSAGGAGVNPGGSKVRIRQVPSWQIRPN